MLSTSPDLRIAWRGPSLLLTDMYGECAGGPGIAGYYYREARHLSRLRLLLGGESPRMCELGESEPYRLELVYNYPEMTEFGGGGSGESGDARARNALGIEYRSIDARLEYQVHVAGVRATLTIANRAERAAELPVTFEVAADFDDLQEALGAAADHRIEKPVRCVAGEGVLRLRCEHPELPLETRVTGDGARRWTAEPGRLTTTVRLEPREELRLTLDIEPRDETRPLSPEEAAARERRLREWHDGITQVSIPEHRLAEHTIMRAAHDLVALSLLEGPEDEWLAPQAGLPLYPALFGRDALTAGWQAGMLDQCDLLTASLTKVERLQGTTVDPWRDEQPGRIVQQRRTGPLARLGITPFARYYADYASPLMFVVALANRYAWRGDDRELARHWDAACRVMDWAREYGDCDGDGYLEYQTQSPQGPRNQGWKDSGDAIVFEDGRTVPTPLADCEIQGYWYAAQQMMAAMCVARGELGDARAHWESARQLKERFNRDWWMPEEGFIALAMGPDKRLARSIASNPGHCLASGIVDEAHVPAVVGRLFAPDLFSGWGIRTLSTGHPRYNPVSYHRGSVWLVENATIAFGLRRFGFDARALELARAAFDLAELYDGFRVPEAVGGYARGERPFPGAYPRANRLQAWNASAMPLLLQTLLGLQPLARLDLLVADPVLPEWMPEVRLTGLRVGGATATLRCWRDRDGRSHVETEHVRGTLRLVRQPPPESMTVGWGERVRRLVTH